MSDLALLDIYTSGHHEHYFKSLQAGLTTHGYTPEIIGAKRFEALADSSSFFRLEMKGARQAKGFNKQYVTSNLFLQALHYAQKNDIRLVHFLYADWHLAAIAYAYKRLAFTTGDGRVTPVLTIHWASGAGVGDSMAERLRRYPHRLALRYLVNNMNARVVVHTESVKDAVAKLVPENSIVLVPYPLMPQVRPVSSEVANFRARIGVGHTDKLLLCFGGTRFDKGVDLAIKALSYLSSDYHLIIAGKPEYFTQEKLKELIHTYNVADRVKLNLDYQSDNDMVLKFASSDLVLLPYRSSFQGQSGPLTQAAAYAKPVVVADIPSLRETVKKYDLGELARPEDPIDIAQKISEALDSSRFQKEAANKFISEHSPESFARHVLAAYY